MSSSIDCWVLEATAREAGTAISAAVSNKAPSSAGTRGRELANYLIVIFTVRLVVAVSGSMYPPGLTVWPGVTRFEASLRSVGG